MVSMDQLLKKPARSMQELAKEYFNNSVEVFKTSGYGALHKELLGRMYLMRDEILVAWWAEHGYAPGKAVAVQEFINGSINNFIREATEEEMEKIQPRKQEAQEVEEDIKYLSKAIFDNINWCQKIKDSWQRVIDLVRTK
jgi:hypothetical protein